MNEHFKIHYEKTKHVVHVLDIYSRSTSAAANCMSCFHRLITFMQNTVSNNDTFKFIFELLT